MSFTDYFNLTGDTGGASSGGASSGGRSGLTLPQGLFSDIGGAIGDIFAAMGDQAKAQAYDAAAALAGKEEQFTEESTRVKAFQTQREIFGTIGAQQAEVAGAGVAAGGTALDLLRDSASQGALAKAMVQQQGLITEEGYREQQQAYTTMASAARTSATGAEIGAGIQAAAAVASVFFPPV